MDWIYFTTIRSKNQTNVREVKKQKGEGACERVRRGTIPLMSKDTSLHVQFMKKNIYLKRLCLLLLVVLCTILLFFLQYRYDNKYHFPGIQGEQGICGQTGSHYLFWPMAGKSIRKSWLPPANLTGRSLILSIWDSTEVLKPVIKTAILMAAPRIGWPYCFLRK